jgi:hypothetical protein
MKKKILPLLAATLLLSLLTGCFSLALGSGSKSEVVKPTIGQQLIDLQRARQSGLINDAEYQQQRAKILDGH